ncbi:MAG: SipW-dependent-type signal peptide-containing protein, partial [Candidatus Methanomethylophilaceae archaeon]|nr:SipW-dependent-type signal peptide-containing protein [Candidatus Methanomethylophilaceae archaeon]
MKAQTKAILASLVVMAVALSAVSGVTYSWWSDSENTDITVGTGNLDVDVGGIEYWVGAGASGSFTVNEKQLQTDSANGVDATSLSLITNIDNVAPRDQYFLQYDVTFSTTIYSKYMVQVETDVDWIEVGVETVDDVTLTYNGSVAEDNLSGVELSEWTSMPGSDVSPLDGVYASQARVLVTLTILDNAPQKPVSGDRYLGDAEGYVDAHVSIVNIITQELNDSDIWNGLVGQVPAVSDGIMYIETAAELAAFAKDVNSGNDYSGITVRLSNDIDLNNIAWTPIGLGINSDKDRFKGTFDGQGNTIYNLNVTKDSTDKAAGLFGVLNGTVENLNVVGAKVYALTSGGAAVIAGSIFNTGLVTGSSVSDVVVEGNHYVGGIAGYAYGSVTGCSVTNALLTATPNEVTDNIYDNGDKVGGIVGYCGEGNNYLTNNVVKDVNIAGYRDMGCIAGCVNDATHVTGNTIEGINTIKVNRSLPDVD